MAVTIHLTIRAIGITAVHFCTLALGAVLRGQITLCASIINFGCCVLIWDR